MPHTSLVDMQSDVATIENGLVGPQSINDALITRYSNVGPGKCLRAQNCVPRAGQTTEFEGTVFTTNPTFKTNHNSLKSSQTNNLSENFTNLLMLLAGCCEESHTSQYRPDLQSVCYRDHLGQWVNRNKFTYDTNVSIGVLY